MAYREEVAHFLEEVLVAVPFVATHAEEMLLMQARSARTTERSLLERTLSALGAELLAEPRMLLREGFALQALRMQVRIAA